LLGKKLKGSKLTESSVWRVAELLRQGAISSVDPAEQTAQRLYSRLVAHYLSNHQPVPLDADSFYRWHAAQPLDEVTADA
jgi:hypothetical protein